MPDAFLDICYECAVFPGLPLFRLSKYRSFECAHDTHKPPIVGLAQFNEYFHDVLQLFLDNNFAEEYATRYPNEHTADTRFAGCAGPSAQDSPAQCETRLRALRSTIMHLGPHAIHTEINRLWEFHGEDWGPEMRLSIRGFILKNHTAQFLKNLRHREETGRGKAVWQYAQMGEMLRDLERLC